MPVRFAKAAMELTSTVLWPPSAGGSFTWMLGSAQVWMLFTVIWGTRCSVQLPYQAWRQVCTPSQDQARVGPVTRMCRAKHLMLNIRLRAPWSLCLTTTFTGSNRRITAAMLPVNTCPECHTVTPPSKVCVHLLTAEWTREKSMTMTELVYI